VTLVRGERVDGALVRVETNCEVAAVGKPEVAVELLAQHRRSLGPLATRGVVPRFLGEVRTSEVRGVCVALHLAERDGGLGDPAVAVADAVPGVLPALVPETGGCRPVVLDVAVAVAVAAAHDPVERAFRMREEAVDELARKPPSAQLTKQHDEEGRGVGRAVVDVPAAEMHGRGTTEAHLVEDATGLLLGRRVDLRALEPRQRLEHTGEARSR
jgi:hypothetical protein